MRISGSRGLALGVLACTATLGATPARAVDNLIAGKIALVKPGTLAKGVFKGSFAVPSSAGGSFLNLLDTLSSAGNDTYNLPEAQWKGLGSPPGAKGWKYKGSGSPTDPCKVVLVKSSVIKYVCKGGGIALNPPFAQNLGVALTVGDQKYCASFGGTVIKNESGQFKAKDASAPVACPTAGSTTTTTTASTTTTTGGACCGGATRLSFTTGVGSGNCGEVLKSDGSQFIPIACGGLYFGGGSNTVPLPATLPDMGTALTKVQNCSGDVADLDNTSSAETGSNLTCTSVGCLFGAPLPIPNASSPPTSTCVVNKVATDASGTVNCATGEANIVLPLTSDIYLTGDLLAGEAGIQPCPLCTGGTCKGGPNDTMPCTAQTGDLGDPYPTSHDCPPSNFIGGLPIGFNLTSGTQAATAIAGTGGSAQARVFCGFCRDADDTGFFENPANLCIDKGVAVGGGCSGTFEACEQNANGAFGPGGGGANTITATGQAAGNLNDLAAHASKLVSIFCIPPTFDATIDAAANLPGPGTSALEGTTQLLP